MPKILKHKPGGDEEGYQSQWVVLLDDKCPQVSGDTENIPVFCKLKHPCTGRPSLHLFTHSDQHLHEVLQFKEDFRSWFIGQTVQQDGRLFVATPVDPIYFILPYLLAASKSGQFMQLDQILHDDQLSETRRLCSCQGTSELDKVAEVKGDRDLQVFRYSQDLTLNWLKQKVYNVMDRLKKEGISLSESHVSTYVKSSTVLDQSEESYMRYACGLVSEYLPESLSESLTEFLGVKEPLREKPVLENQPASKKVKLESVNPTEDYSKLSSNVPGQKKVKLTATQKKLSKVDKTGMKNISSFFSPKAAQK